MNQCAQKIWDKLKKVVAGLISSLSNKLKAKLELEPEKWAHELLNKPRGRLWGPLRCQRGPKKLGQILWCRGAYAPCSLVPAIAQAIRKILKMNQGQIYVV